MTTGKKTITVFRIGSDSRPADTTAIEDFKSKLAESMISGDPIVTHHAVDYFTVEIDKDGSSDTISRTLSYDDKIFAMKLHEKNLISDKKLLRIIGFDFEI